MAGVQAQFDWLGEKLDELARRDLRRGPMEVLSAQGPRLIVRDGEGGQRTLVNFCSNNYLNLAADPRIVQAACQAIQRWGFGSGASRLISGTTALHRQAERAIAGFLQADDAILLSTGYMTNVAAVTALAGPGDLVILDKLDHASLIDAARQSGATLRVYPHGRLDKLERLLREAADKSRRSFVLIDSLFSMDGDVAPLAEIVALKDRYLFTLLVDEAHAIGVFGEHGRGVAETLGLGRDAIDVTVGTCSKALGGAGGFVAGRQVLIDVLRNTARPFVYSTAPPAALAAAAIEAVGIVQAEPHPRRELLAMAERFRDGLRADGWDIGRCASHIIPIIWGSPARALAAQKVLLDHGLLAVAIRPPTVPRGSSRLRVSLMFGHTGEDLERLRAALSKARQDIGA